MKILLAYVVLIAVPVANAAAQPDKKSDIDASKLVGRWGTTVKGKVATGFPVEEFTQDGKYSLGAADARLKLNGTYKVDGNTLTITIGGAPGVPPDVRKRVIKKLTDSSLTYTEGKQTETRAKVK